MSDPFVHLRVASGYSLQYGAAHPSALVAKAVAQDMDTLALTDRDGLYGAVRFAKACLATGVAPIVGVDFGIKHDHAELAQARVTSRTPVRGGAIRDVRLPRVVTLATSRRGWGSLCRLTSATHLAGRRGEPACSRELIAEHGADLVLLLGADSELGLALAAGLPELAEQVLAGWRSVLPDSQIVVAATNHQLPGTGPGSAGHAGRMIAFADAHRLTGVLTNNVRMAERSQAATIDVLDSARRLVPLDIRNVDRRNAEGYLKSGKEILPLLAQVSRLAGRSDEGERLIRDTRNLAVRARLDPRADIGLGEIHLPEFAVLDDSGRGGDAFALLRQRCEAGVVARYPGMPSPQVRDRLEAELDVVGGLGFASYFLTVADVVRMVGDLGIRCAARGSGAGSLINYLLGISGVDPIRYGLIMERFLSPLRQALPDIDLDVESARREEVYTAILDRFGGDRVACVAMLDTYRVRHAVRDVGAALSLPPAEIDAIAKSFPHIRAADAKAALRDLPELRRSGLGERRLDVLFSLVESLDGLPRHVALHPCGVLLSDTTLLDRTPVEASFAGFPMSQFDKDDVEDMGLLKLDVLGIRMQSAMAHALVEISRVEGKAVDIDSLSPFDDPLTYDLIGKAATLGCFQIESPGQRELIGKFGPSDFADIVIDISLFRPGPVKSDMVIPFLEARHGWRRPIYLHPDLEPALAETGGVVVFHEQIIQIVAIVTGCSLAQGDEARRALGDPQGQRDVKRWFFPAARARGYAEPVIERIWQVLESFASFGFCKAHAAAFALPTYQSAWLKTHYPAHFLSGVLTHDPGMYPKRLILEEARRLGIEILGLDVNASEDTYRVERLSPVKRLSDSVPEVVEGAHALAALPLEITAGTGAPPASAVLAPRTRRERRLRPGDGLPDGRGYGIRLALSDLLGINLTETARIVAGRPYHSLSDFWSRAQVSAPVAERLVLAGAFDSIYGITGAHPVRRREQVTRRDLLLSLADMIRLDRVDARMHGRARGLRLAASVEPDGLERSDPRDAARRQSARAAQARPQEVQLPLDLWGSTDPLQPAIGVEPELSAGVTLSTTLRTEGSGRGSLNDRVWRFDPMDSHVGEDDSCLDAAPARLATADVVPTGLPEMTDDERLGQELAILGLDASRHLMHGYLPFLEAIGVTFSADLLARRSRSDLLVAGVKVATQTPPVRSGRRVVFLTLDDTTGPVDATFFEDAQGPYAATVFESWTMVVRGELRRTGPRGVSLRATGCWDLDHLHGIWLRELDESGDLAAAVQAVHEVMTIVPDGFGMVGEEIAGDAAEDAAQQPSRGEAADAQQHTRAGGMGRRRVLVHASGFKQSPYADVKPAGTSAADAPRKLWHSSPGSSGR